MIPAEAIAEVKARVELVGFIEAQGIPLKRAGKGYLGLCRFHDDRRPSLSVDPAKQYWCCLGACSTPGKVMGGDVIEFARRLWKVGLSEALERLGGRTRAALVPRNGTRHPLHAVPRIGGPRPPIGPALLSQVVAVYHQGFLGSTQAKEYAASRGLTSAELLSALPIGYADGSLLERAPEGSETHEALKALGIVTASGRELLAGCLVVPMRDLAGEVVSLYGRAIGRDQHLYLPGPRRGLVNAQCAATCDELILTESILDALSFLAAGIPNAVPLYGVNGWTPDHEALIEKHRIRRVVLALDSDAAGRGAAAALAEKLRGRGIEVLDVVFA
jgi:DNA primase catalytic core